MLLLGIDVGTSSIKVSIVDSQTAVTVASAQYPDQESAIQAPKPGWAEQDPEMWWEHVQQAILKANATGLFVPTDIGAIGIAYQMHGLVAVDKDQHSLFPSIIWCDSRAVEIGEKAFEEIGEEKCLTHLLNSPGNFTASKLAWVKQFRPADYEKIDKIMLPGDFISMKLTGHITTSISSLSEGVFWDFKEKHLSADVMDYYHFDTSLIPATQDVFSDHGYLKEEIATALSLKSGIPVTYKAGDQPNNALSLNVMEPGEVAATAGTSGVIYGVTDQLVYDRKSRVNSFAHVNHSAEEERVGVLLCINGTGILNRWMKTTLLPNGSYQQMNEAAGKIAPGSDGLRIIPFGNGAERILENRQVGAQILQLDLNQHGPGHMYRAAQEGIAFAFRYGLDIMRENGMNPSIIRAGKANLFLSDIFVEAFVNATGVPVEMYASDGSAGAAIGAGIGVKVFKNAGEAFRESKSTVIIEPTKTKEYDELYQDWLRLLH